MKAMIVAAGFFPLVAPGATAQAKFAPIEPQKALTVSINDTAMTSEPLGAMLESNYFNAPPVPFAVGRVFPCRLQLRVFDKTRIAQSCR